MFITFVYFCDEALGLDLENNLKTYYKRRGWDWETGKPSKEKLKELGLLLKKKLYFDQKLILFWKIYEK